MCGIIGIIGKSDVAQNMVEALRRLEYRGYDSAGIATISNKEIIRLRAEGKLSNLERKLYESPVVGKTGIGHTRWATHGVPSTDNAHPHATDKVAVVHNGIIENFAELKAELIKKGYKFTSETDTEVVPVLITSLLDEGLSEADAVAKTLQRLHGAYALGIIFKQNPDLLIGARKGSPLAVGYGDGEMYLGSDAIALAPLTSKISYLEEGDWVILSRNSAAFFDKTGNSVSREVKISSISSGAIDKDGYRHYMLKEIYEQPTVIGENIQAYLNNENHSIILPEHNLPLKKINRMTIVACGTSYYAGSVASYWFERISGIPTEINIASEFRYRDMPMLEGGLALFISQSGETADTLAAMRMAKEKKQYTIALVNSPESSMAHEADLAIRTYAGPEIGVASTKAFTTQLVTLACLAIYLGIEREYISKSESDEYLRKLLEIPAKTAEVLEKEDEIHRIALKMATATNAVYIGRGTSYPIALEGALKLKEISYIHAEGFAAGELKHGPIALIDENIPVVAIAPHDKLFEKTASNIQEVAARNGKIVLFSNKAGIETLKDISADCVEMPEVCDFLSAIVYAIPIQLLAYHVAVLKGTDVDQPRNLAKSVTVE